MKALLISGAKEVGESATVEVNGVVYECMDCLVYSSKIENGQEFVPRFSWLDADDDTETWESIFSGNPQQRRELVPLGGWSYQAYGQIISVEPPLADCGILLPSPVSSNDSSIIGSFVTFKIVRLDVSRA